MSHTPESLKAEIERLRGEERRVTAELRDVNGRALDAVRSLDYRRWSDEANALEAQAVSLTTLRRAAEYQLERMAVAA